MNSAQRRKNRFRVQAWEREGGLKALVVLAKMHEFPPGMIDEYLLLPFMARYNRRHHVKAWVTCKAPREHVAMFRGRWLDFACKPPSERLTRQANKLAQFAQMYGASSGKGMRDDLVDALAAPHLSAYTALTSNLPKDLR